MSLKVVDFTQAWHLRARLLLCAFVAFPLSMLPSPVLGDYTWGEAKFSGATMGTLYHVSIEYNSYDYAEEAFQPLIDARLEEINALMSTYDANSALSRFNASRSTDWFEVSEELAMVVEKGLEIAEKTGGTFDPTVGPIVNLWGFGPDKRRTKPPTDEEIAEALKAVGYKNIEVQLDPPALRKTNPDVYLDLSAIAKGYAADAVVEVLSKPEGSKPVVDCAMVEIGGEVRTYEKKRDDAPWRIGIERPDTDARLISKVVEIDNGDGLATSGDYRNFFEHKGRRYSHTIDPATGKPVEHRLATVTVRAPTCMEADALATALLVMGPDKGLVWANSHQVAAVLIERTDDGFRENATKAWVEFEAERSTDSLPTKQESTMGTYFVITVFVFAVALTGMAIGVILSNRRIKGTCGGLAGLQDPSGKTACEICSNPSPTCTGTPERQSEAVNG